MSVIQNQQTSLLKFISINNVEITNHNRKHSLSEVLSISDTETASGRIRRFYKKNKKTLSLTFTYLPGPVAKTVDGRVGRDFIHNLALTNPNIAVEYKDCPTKNPVSFNGFIVNYSESIVRRDLPSQCIYYDVQLEIEEA